MDPLNFLCWLLVRAGTQILYVLRLAMDKGRAPGLWIVHLSKVTTNY